MRYDMDIKVPQATAYATDAEQPAQPLTVEIMHQTGVSLESASRIYGRLHELRNRLFGEPNAVKPGMSGKKALPRIDSFSEAFRSRTVELSVVLNELDYLSTELANRL